MHPSERRDFGNIVQSYHPRSFLSDQAESLVILKKEAKGQSTCPGYVENSVTTSRSNKSQRGKVIAITSGKGGVGKTNIAVNLALAIAGFGKKTLLVDLDLGLANIDILMDVEIRFNLSHVISGKKKFEEVIVPAYDKLYLVAGATGVERLANLTDVERRILVNMLDDIENKFDYIIFDTGAGVSKNTIDFVATADDAIIITTPEPTAIIDAYTIVKMLSGKENCANLYILVNMAKMKDEAERTSYAIAETTNKFLNSYLGRLGYILRDTCVCDAVVQRCPFFLRYPYSQASRSIKRVAITFLSVEKEHSFITRPSFARRIWEFMARRL
jgi:flagellar biosynthesis protein FlhG